MNEFTNLYRNIKKKYKNIDITLTKNYKQLLDEKCFDEGNRNNIIVFDMIYCCGGAYMYLQSLIKQYSDKVNFIIIRETKNLDIYISINDEYFLNKSSITINNILEFINQVNHKFIFVNSLATQSKQYIDILSTLKQKITITHDFSFIYNRIHPVKLNHIQKVRNINFYDLIITQNSENLVTMKLDANDTVVSRMPDFYKQKKKMYTNNRKIHIGVIGSISEVKGNLFLKGLIDFLTSKNLFDNYEFRIFGNSHPYLKEFAFPYVNIEELNEMLIDYKPNILLECSIWPETWSYTLTISKLTNLPILFLKKSFESVVKDRLSNYNAYEFETINQCVNLINKNYQKYFYTIENTIEKIPFYDCLFLGNYVKNMKLKNTFIENLIIITSKIVVSSLHFKYGQTKIQRSVYTREKRLEQTLATIKSIKKYFPENHKLLLIDNSILTISEKQVVLNHVDIALFRDDIENIDSYTDNHEIKAYGEVAQTQQVLKYIKNENITFKNLFKITGRYLINQQFNFRNFTTEKNVFKLSVEYSKINNRDYYYTCFYKISSLNFEYYKSAINDLLLENSILTDKTSLGLEQDLPDLILQKNKDSIQTVEELGIYQIISVWHIDPNCNYNI